ncbi:MAG: prenyltransferase/squalene oxidase repeat-containing protein [Candidatus Thorarchaeota archaeon]
MTRVNLHYDIESFIIDNGSVADKLRLAAAGYDQSKSMSKEILTELSLILNNDGGVPFGLIRGNPSSVKETAEILPLLLRYRKEQSAAFDQMVSFLVTRQKSDGGFAETLNIDPYIEDKWGGTTGRDWYPAGKSITWLTGKALEALCLAEFPDEERLRRARDFLIYSQYEDGHWPDFKDQDVSDPLATGNILPALLAVGVTYDHKVYVGGRAALLHHLKESVEAASTIDMVDLIAVGKPASDLELEVLNSGLGLIGEKQNKDGGWSQIGSKKSDPELSSILAYVIQRCC